MRTRWLSLCVRCIRERHQYEQSEYDSCYHKNRFGERMRNIHISMTKGTKVCGSISKRSLSRLHTGTSNHNMLFSSPRWESRHGRNKALRFQDDQ